VPKTKPDNMLMVFGSGKASNLLICASETNCLASKNIYNPEELQQGMCTSTIMTFTLPETGKVQQKMCF